MHIGSHVFFGPRVSIYTAVHPIAAAVCRTNLEYVNLFESEAIPAPSQASRWEMAASLPLALAPSKTDISPCMIAGRNPCPHTPPYPCIGLLELKHITTGL